MSTDDDRRLDDELRRRARDASERHRVSIMPADIDQALSAAKSGLGDEPRRDAVGRKRTGWILAAAAAAIAILVGGAAWWPAGESDDRLTSASDVDTDPGISIDGADQSQPSAAPAPITAPASTTTTVVDLPSVALDTEGNEMATFRFVDGRAVIEAESTASTDTLLDYLLNRSTILGDTISEREQALFGGGLRIRTTLDPALQQAAEQARNELPETEMGFDAAIVSIETSSGAVRAIVSGDGSMLDDSRINTAITPRPTGSAIETFILAAALQAGAQPDDLIDGRRGCVLPGPWTDPDFVDVEEPYFFINGGVAGSIGPLDEMVARSIPCASARLSHIVGLDRVVDTMYRMAESPYLFAGQSANVREPIEPVTDLARGVNPMSPLDMASGLQAIANVGVHQEPYFVESIDNAEGGRQYIHERAPTTVLDPDVALDAVDVLRGTITDGTGRRGALADDRPAIGKTGTNQSNTDAWLIGATPQLTTAVWVGDPVASTPMIAIPEFLAVGVHKVQGGLFPAQIWKAFTDAALADEPIEDWDSAAPPERAAARLVLPGYECVIFDGGELVWLESDDIGTNVPPGETDPNFPIPSVAPDALVDGCN
jgi:membrane peptidoglycan carboxypeptidase